jgi:hypothetical protein
MMRNVRVEDNTADEIRLQRELRAATIMRVLLRYFNPRTAIAIAMTQRGQDRILRTEDVRLFMNLCQRTGPDEAWVIAFRAGLFLHMDMPLLPGISFDINAMATVTCESRFRFDHAGIKALVVHMNFPAVIITPVHGDRASAVEAVCLVLDRLTFPRKWDDLATRYDRHVSSLSQIFTYMLHKIFQSAKERIMMSRTTTPARLERYAQAFWRRRVPRDLRIWSVIDVKKVKNCRATHKYHCFKYQTLETPDGM